MSAKIWMAVAFFTLGLSVGVLMTSFFLLNRIPPTTEISVGKAKIKGRDNTIENLIETGDITTKKEQRQSRREARRSARLE